MTTFNVNHHKYKYPKWLPQKLVRLASSQTMSWNCPSGAGVTADTLDYTGVVWACCGVGRVGRFLITTAWHRDHQSWFIHVHLTHSQLPNRNISHIFKILVSLMYSVHPLLGREWSSLWTNQADVLAGFGFVCSANFICCLLEPNFLIKWLYVLL